VFKFLGNKRLFILMIGLIFFIALMGLTLGRAKMIWPEKALKDTISWTQGLFYKPARYIAGLFEDVRELRTVYQENRVLRQTLSQYARDTALLNQLESENKRLKEELAFTERQKEANQYRYRIAQVVSLSPDPYNRTVTINLGAKDGIRENMAVVSTSGLLGRTVQVSDFYTNVQLLSDINDATNESKAIAVTVQGKEDSFGIIEKFDPETGMLVMTKIPQTDPIAEGDTVVTSGLGQVFPAGIEVGKVVSKEVGEFGITYKAMIKPFSSFEHLKEVFVVEMPELR